MHLLIERNEACERNGRNCKTETEWIDLGTILKMQREWERSQNEIMDMIWGEGIHACGVDGIKKMCGNFREQLWE